MKRSEMLATSICSWAKQRPQNGTTCLKNGLVLPVSYSDATCRVSAPHNIGLEDYQILSLEQQVAATAAQQVLARQSARLLPIQATTQPKLAHRATNQTGNTPRAGESVEKDIVPKATFTGMRTAWHGNCEDAML